MAQNTLLKAHVTIIDSWTEGNPTGKRHRVVKASYTPPAGDTIVAGGQTNKLKADAFGLDVIESCSQIYATTPLMWQAVPAPDGSYIMTVPNEAASSAPADVTLADGKVAYITVRGYNT